MTERASTPVPKPGSGGRVHFAGRQVRPAPYLAAADAFVLPSGYEPFGLAMLEAGASGLPLIVTRTEGSDELVRHGENGFVVSREPGRVRRGTLADLGRGRAAGARHRRAGTGPGAPYAWSRVTEAYAEVLA